MLVEARPPLLVCYVPRMHLRRAILLAALTLTATLSAQIAPSRFAEMRWRSIGPYRGGRTVAAVGIPSQPNVFYIGVNNGGVWKTTDAGRTWVPIFDDQPTQSIGALAIAPMEPVGWSSKIGVQMRPASVVFHTPPLFTPM